MIQNLKLEGKKWEQIAFKIELQQVLSYEVTDPSLMEDELLHRFASTSSVIHGWPYMREIVTSLILKFGYPPLFLPLIPIAKDWEE